MLSQFYNAWIMLSGKYHTRKRPRKNRSDRSLAVLAFDLLLFSVSFCLLFFVCLIVSICQRLRAYAILLPWYFIFYALFCINLHKMFLLMPLHQMGSNRIVKLLIHTHTLSHSFTHNLLLLCRIVHIWVLFKMRNNKI